MIPVNDRILDHACTLLAALRLGIPLESLPTGHWRIHPNALRRLLESLALLGNDGLPEPEATRAFLEASLPDALVKMAHSWMESESFDDLRLVPGLRFEGNWENNPLHTRRNILEILSELPKDTWWSLPAFIAAVKEQKPDFQRTAGEYESWHIYSEAKGGYLRGFASWDDVEGALLRFLISGPLHALGILELAAGAVYGEVTAFRPSPWAENLWHGWRPENLPEGKKPIRAFSDGRLAISHLTPRAVRYLVSRFVHWEEEKEFDYATG